MIDALEPRLMFTFTSQIQLGVATIELHTDYNSFNYNEIRVWPDGDYYRHDLPLDGWIASAYDFDWRYSGTQSMPVISVDSAFMFKTDGESATRFRIQGAGAFYAPVTVTGGNAYDTLIIEDHGPGTPTDAVITSNQITYGSFQLLYSELRQIVFDANDATNHVVVNGGPSSLAIALGGGDDTVQVNAPPSEVWLRGGPGTDRATVMGSAAADDIAFVQRELNAPDLTPPEWVPPANTVFLLEMEHVAFDALDGDDAVDASFSGVPITVDAGPGADTVLGSHAADSIIGGDGDDLIDGGGAADQVSGGIGTDTLVWDAADTLNADGDVADVLWMRGTEGDDNITIDAALIGTWASVRADGLGGNDVITALNVPADLTIDAGDGSDQVLLTHLSTSRDLHVSAAEVLVFQGTAFSDTLNLGAIGLVNVGRIEINAADGYDVVRVPAAYLGAGTELVIVGGLGNDRLELDYSGYAHDQRLWIQPSAVVDDVLGVTWTYAEIEHITVTMGPGNDDVVLERSAPPVTINGAGGSDRVTLNGSDGYEQFKTTPDWLSGDGETLENVEALTIDAKGGDDLIGVGVNPMLIAVMGGDGNDRVVVLQGVLGETPGLTVDGGPGDDSVTVSHGAAGSVQVAVTDEAISSGGNWIALADVEQLSVRASGGDDVIDASARTLPVTLSGGLGADTLIGGSGDDAIWGEDGGDSLIGGGGVDDVDGGAGTDTIVSDGRDVLVAGAGAEDDLHLRGSEGDDEWMVGAELVGVWRAVVIESLGGNDVVTVLSVPAGLSINGGAGDDQLRVVNSIDAPLAGTVAFDGGDGVDGVVVVGTEGADSFVIGAAMINQGLVTTVNSEALTIDALGGDDLVAVASHAVDTTVLGGAGSDVVRVAAAGLREKILRIVGGGDVGHDLLRVSGTGAADAFRLRAGAIEAGAFSVRHEEMDAVQVLGGGGDDLFIVKGQTALVRVSGGAGDDALTLRATNAQEVRYNGGDGADGVRALGTTGDDVITVRAGRIMAGAFSTRLSYVEEITVEGLGGNDLLDASRSDLAVTLFGGEGDDHLIGSAGADLLRGGAGVDVIEGDERDLR